LSDQDHQNEPADSASDKPTPAESSGSTSSLTSSSPEDSVAEATEPMLLRSRKSILFVVLVLIAGSSWGLSEFQLWQARKAIVARDPELALVWLDRIERFGIDRAETMFLMARAYRRMGQFAKTRSCLQAALDRGFSPERVKREEILALAQSGQLQQSVPFLADMLGDPGDDGAEICEAFASGYLAAYLVPDAFTLVEAWQKDFPEDAQPYFFRGRYAVHMGNLKEAIREFEQALKRSPNRRDIRNELASCLIELIKYDEAEKHLSKLLKEDPSDVVARLNWAKCLQHTDRIDEAERHFQVVLKADPDNETAKLQLGRMLVSAGKPEEALGLAKALYEKSPKNVDAAFLFAQVLRLTDQGDRAQKLFDEVKQARVDLDRAYVLIDRLDPQKAAASDRVEIGRLLVTNGEDRAGISWLMSALQIDAECLDAHELLAKQFEKTQPERSKQHAKLARKLRQEKRDEKNRTKKPKQQGPAQAPAN
jgi:tetratricopeptide (TPR) repeat protein